MRQYELMLVLKAGTVGDDSKKRDALLHKIVGASVKLAEVKNLGTKRLAYPILKQNEGEYFLANLEAERVSVSDIQNQTKLLPDVLRYLLIVKE